MITSRQCYTQSPSESADNRAQVGRLSIVGDLTKLKLTSMATLPALFAYLAATSGNARAIDLLLLFISVLGSASGAAALNEWSERKIDSKMKRTRLRPLPAGNCSPQTALILGLTLTATGVLFLTFYFNALAGFLALLAAVVYWLFYTPLKPKTPWCTEVGAISGALPPLIGWAAATGELTFFAWIFFATLFFWQMPHFHPISWRYREDYRKAGLKMRVVTESSGDQAASHTIGYALILLGVTLLPFLLGKGGVAMAITPALFGSLYLAASIRFRFAKNRDRAARFLFRFSLIYLPVVLIALTFNSIR